MLEFLSKMIHPPTETVTYRDEQGKLQKLTKERILGENIASKERQFLFIEATKRSGMPRFETIPKDNKFPVSFGYFGAQYAYDKWALNPGGTNKGSLDLKKKTRQNGFMPMRKLVGKLVTAYYVGHEGRNELRVTVKDYEGFGKGIQQIHMPLEAFLEGE